MSSLLTNVQLQLLFALCFMAGEHQLTLAEKLLNGSLSSSEVDEVCELISNEFLINGIEESFEPNSYGLELELLLDAVNRGRDQGR
ncbi:hypothetical protein QN382_23505 [Pseudomonas sp. 10B1]|uniref:hypothetical protein n=1 Tax=unclassified Pseudomonas TaxID=196821 RepID=UPI002B2303C5|nr:MULTISPECIES: hypothetical protein [unclassified Pseudomonas]MEA9976445.1 hypothetical protein [Pseudomonas sp. RTS4]MEA9997444.1 hypothetical protein [Pseudomonas sp. AA4]MEB0089543.1 hypothetical protein [Pseudomonas sp. RTI1]MEB0128613.1 hypothetical protein [Pseudomonas sp. CCC1.2]MEB0155972.1 hypothetical protein [Pseudomonas sp. CCC4.3]